MTGRVLVMLFCVLSAAVAAACGGDKGTTPTAQTTISDSAQEMMFGVQHSMMESGIKKAALSADTTFVFANQTRFELRGSVRLELLDSIGGPKATLTAREATYSTPLKSMEARGTVVVITTDGKRLDTQHLIYDQTSDKIRSDSAFVITEPTRRISGRKFNSDPKLELLDCADCVVTSLAPIRVDTGPANRPVPPPVIPPPFESNDQRPRNRMQPQ